MPRLPSILFLGGIVWFELLISQLGEISIGPVGKLQYAGVLRFVGLSPDSDKSIVVVEVANFLFFCVKQRLV